MALLAWLAAFLLLIGTFLLAQRTYVWDAGLLILLASAFILSRLLARRSRKRTPIHLLRSVSPIGIDAWVRIAAVATSLVVALVARSRPVEGDFTLLLAVWLAAVAAFIAVAAAPLMRSGLLDPGFTPSEWALLAGLLLVAGLLRFVRLGDIPVNLSGDEGTQLVAARNLVRVPMGNPFATGWYSVPTMSFLAYGGSMLAFGFTIAGGRALSAALGTFTILTTLLLARKLGGRRVGWIAAAIVAFLAYHIHFSRLASNQIADPLVGTLALWLLWSGLQPEAAGSGRRDRPPLWALMWGISGVVAGLGWYAYFGARWVTILMALVLAWRTLATPGFLRRRWRGLVLLAAGWLVAVLPLLGWYAAHPSPFTERMNAVSIFASGWLEREMATTGQSAWPILLDQAWRAVSAFHLTPDRTFWYFPDRPLLDAVTAAMLIVGVMAAMLKIRWPSRALCLIWLASTLVVAWGLTESPPSSQRGLLMVPPVAILAAWGLEGLRDLLLRDRHRWGATAAAVIVLEAIAVANGVFYFGVYTPRRIYGNPTAEKATAFARYTLANPQPVCPVARRGPCQGRIYFVGRPFMTWDFGTLAFLLARFPGVDVPEGEVPLIEGPARVAIVAERVNEAEVVRTLYPGGRETVLESPDGRLLMVVYDLPAR